MAQVLICGGGSGGHLLPAIALADELDKREVDNLLITDQRVKQFLPKGRDKTPIINGGTNKTDLASRIKLLLHWIRLWFALKKQFKTLQPKVIVCFGGYITPAPALAAKWCGAKLILHEQNAVLGAANRLLKLFADVVTTAHPLGISHSLVVGIPAQKPPKKPPKRKLAKNQLGLLVLGGSQGAKGLVNTLLEALELKAISASLRKRLKLTLQCPKDWAGDARKRLKPLGIQAKIAPFFPNIQKLLAQSDLVISRAGAGSLNSIGLAQKPAIVMPYPQASHQHQQKNAELFTTQQWIIQDGEAGRLAQTLAKALRGEIGSPSGDGKSEGLPSGLPSAEAANRLADVVMALAVQKIGSGTRE